MKSVARVAALTFVAACCADWCAADVSADSPELQKLLLAGRLKPDDPVLLSRLAGAYSKLGRDSDVVRTLSRLVDVSRRQPEARALIPEALTLIDAIHQRDPKAFESTFLYAELLFLSARYSQALRVLSNIGPHAAANADFFNLAGMCFAGLDDLPKASQALIRAIDLAPDRVDLLVNLAGLYQKARNNDAALMALERAVRMPSASPEAFFALALTHFNLGEFQSAVANCEKAIELNPEFDKAFLLKGRAYVKMAKPIEAVRALEAAGALNAACDQCRLDLAVLLAASGDKIRPARLLREAIAINPRNADAHYQLGKVLSQQNHLEEAIRELEEAVTLDQDQDGARYQLAALYRRRGDREKAAEVLRSLRERKENRRAESQKKLSRN